MPESYCATQSHIVIVTNKVNVSSTIVHQGIQRIGIYAVFPLKGYCYDARTIGVGLIRNSRHRHKINSVCHPTKSFFVVVEIDTFFSLINTKKIQQNVPEKLINGMQEIQSDILN